MLVIRGPLAPTSEAGYDAEGRFRLMPQLSPGDELKLFVEQYLTTLEAEREVEREIKAMYTDTGGEA